MAYNHFPSFFLPALLIALLSFNARSFLVKARNLQDTTELSKPELPPFPQIPTLPKPDLPSFPQIPTLPKPELPELPPLPEIPDLPKPTLPTIPTLPNDLPFPFFSPPHTTSNP
ncbi:hypothetical protein GQ457_10G019770 [Hibiscus cannabinus]